MKITDLLCPQCIELYGRPGSKTEVINCLLDLVMRSGKISDRKSLAASVFEREREISTGIGDGIGIPHGIVRGARGLAVSAMVIPEGTDFRAVDGLPVDLLFLVAMPHGMEDLYLHFLSRLSSCLLQEECIRILRRASTAEEFISAFAMEIPERQFKFENVS